VTVTAFPLAEKNSMDKNKALEAALGQIEPLAEQRPNV